MEWLWKLLGFDKIADGLFEKGIVKLEKDTIYIIHVSAKTTNRDCDTLREKLAENNIQAVIVASDNLQILNF